MSDITNEMVDKFMSDLQMFMRNARQSDEISFEAMFGRRYIRIVKTGRGERSVYCFLDFAGNIYKPDGWKKPAKWIRGSIQDPEIWKNGTIGAYSIRYL